MTDSEIMYSTDANDDMVLAMTRAFSFQGLTRNNDPFLGVAAHQEEMLNELEFDLTIIDGWINKKVEMWTPKDVLFWLSFEAQKIGTMIHKVGAHNFAEIDGRKLLQMTKEDFSRFCSQYGHHFYNCFRKYLDQSYHLDQNSPEVKKKPGRSERSYKKKTECDLTSIDSWCNKTIEEWTPKDVLSWLSSEAQANGTMIHKVGAHNFAEIDGHKLLQMTEEDFSQFCLQYGQDFYNSFQLLKMQMEFHSDRNFYDYNSKFESKMSEASPKVKKKLGRPKGSCTKKTKKRGYIWQFVIDLLHNPNYCPSVICWINYEAGLFKFVKSKKVAELWGNKKGKTNMKYEYFSRALRHHYKKKFLLPVYGRKLVYQFGPKVISWKKPYSSVNKQ